VRSIVVRAIKVWFAVSVGIAVAAFTSPGLGAVLLDAYLLAVAGVLLLALVRTARIKAPPEQRSALDQTLGAMRRSRTETTELGYERDLENSVLSAFHLHRRLRPVLREVAAHRLLTKYGVDLDAEPARARELVGPSAWEIVRPDRDIPEDRRAAGPSLSHLQGVVAELERI
jgi:hypothetical protein